MSIRVILFFLLMYGMHAISLGQESEKRYTEEEITIEKQFIEAKKYKLLGDFEGATQLLELLLKKHRNLDVAAYELADIFFKQEKYEDALDNINHALGIQPNQEWYLRLKAKILSKQNRFIETAEVYKNLNNLDGNLDHLELEAFYYTKAKEYDKAIQALLIIEQRIGITERISMIKYDIYKKDNKKNKALNELQTLCATYPHNVNYKHYLANYFSQLKKQDKAEEIYREILKIDAEDARANMALASKYKKQGDFEGYLNSIKPIIENKNANLDIKIAELMPYIQRLQKENDRSELNTLLEYCEILKLVHPNEAKAFALHGDILSLIGKGAEAIVQYKKTLELDESNYMVWEQMLLNQAQEHKMEELEESSSIAMDLFPNQSMIYYLNGMANTELKRYPNAEDALSQALIMTPKEDPLKVDIYNLLGKVYYALDQFDQSYDSYDNALLIAPNNAAILNDYSYRLALRGVHLKEAKKMHEKALSMESNNPRFIATGAWIQYQDRQWNDAKATLEKAIKRGGDQFSYILEKYGDVLFQLDQKEKALQFWKRAYDKGKGSKWLQRKINEEKLIEAQ